MISLFKNKQQEQEQEQPRFVELNSNVENGALYSIRNVKKMIDESDFSYPFPEFVITTDQLKEMKLFISAITKYINEITKDIGIEYGVEHPVIPDDGFQRTDYDICEIRWDWTSLEKASKQPTSDESEKKDAK